MSYKTRTESNELLTLRALHNRMSLSNLDKQHYLNLKKGYEGEEMFDSWLEKIEGHGIVLNDLLLKVKTNHLQIDSMVIFSLALYFFEVKNYEGDYYFESDRFYMKPKTEINNPLLQLNRSESLLRQLLQNLGTTIPIIPAIVFINPEFTLYQAPLNKPFIFPTQINRLIKNLNALPSKLSDKQKMLADKLVSIHVKDSPFKQAPSYTYDQLRKGVICNRCQSFSVVTIGLKCVCQDCGSEERIEQAIIRIVHEYKLLFPNGKITTNNIFDWSNRAISQKRIRNILEKNFKMIGVHQWAYYE